MIWLLIKLKFFFKLTVGVGLKRVIGIDILDAPNT